MLPGSTGAGAGTAGSNGNVLLAPTGGGNVGIGTNSPTAKLHVAGVVYAVGATTAASQNPIIGGDNTSSGIGTIGHSASGIGVLGESSGNGYGVKGISDNGVAGVYGSSNTGKAIWGNTLSGYAGYFDGKVKINGALSVGNCTGCNPPSDRSLKAHFSTVNPRFILDRLVTIPIQTWNYKDEPATVRHIGAMAQDFRAAFNFGSDNRTLNTVDAQGVTMAAIQGLYQQNQELTRKVEQLQAQLNRVKRTIRSERAAKR